MSALDVPYESCELCPRRCGASRAQGELGICRMGAAPVVARSALHFWEEPPISGERGSGTIFLSGCSLRCVFCQNDDISHGGFGVPAGERRIAQMMLELEEKGAHNINLVTATHFWPHAREAVLLARRAGLSVPIVYNTSGYELPEVVRALGDVVDVWLTDYKYASAGLAGALSGAADYPEVAHAALAQMVEVVSARGGRAVDADGIMRQGIIVRHLVLPGHADDSCAVLDRVWELTGARYDLSVMNQYTPNERCKRRTDGLSGPLSDDEYELVLDHADELGFENLWWQEGGTVSESFIPAFDLSGVQGPELKV